MASHTEETETIGKDSTANTSETTTIELTNDSTGKLDFEAADKIMTRLHDEQDDSNKKTPSSSDPVESLSITQLFRFADKYDLILITFGTIGAAANGTALPLMTIIFGNIINAFLRFQYSAENDREHLESAKQTMTHEVNRNLVLFLILGASVVVLAYCQMAFWMLSGERQAKRIRNLYYAAIMRQDISWFDRISTGDVTTRISGDVTVLQEGISEKVGSIIQYTSTFIAGFVIAFTKGWKLSLVLCCVFPLLAISGFVMAKAMARSTVAGQDAYAAAGTVAEQVISGIRTVTAFGGQQRELARYISRLNDAYKVGKKKALVSGLGLGAMMGIIFSAYALGFWYGGRLVASGDANGGEVLNVFFAIIIGAFSLGNASPSFSSVGNALGAAANLFAVIDRVPPIDVANPSGKKLDKGSVKGRIEFKNVTFHYPQRPDVTVLKDFSLTIEAGETVALVGSSGCGKSTIVSLLERYYDPNSGTVYLDGEDLKKINLKSMRTQIGLVGQEPVLFPENIAQNVKWGADPDYTPTIEEVIEACKKANAHEFIDELPEKYDTLVGEKGALMSGGQKQRIAIARALIKDPKILLLDEATSALDTDSERLVQEALDAAAHNRTTIVIAHRLSTIKNADKIVVMSKGEILEIGKHDELIARQGAYYGLVKAQELKTKSKTEPDADEDDDSSSTTASQSEEAITIYDEKRPKAFMRRMSTKASVTKSVKTIDDIKNEEDAALKEEKTPLARVFRLSSPELPYLLLGGFGATVNGAIMPLFALVFTQILSVFSKVDDPDGVRKDSAFWAGMFVVLAAVSFLGNFSQTGLFTFTGERLTRRLRTMTFAAILKQEMGFFDEEDNSTGALTSKLATDASRVEGLAGSLMGTVLQTFSNIVTGLVIAFANGWKMTLVVLAGSPIIAIGGFLELKALAGFGAKTRKAYEQSGQVVQQSVSNIRTIAALSREETFKKLYREAIVKPHKIAVRGELIAAIGFGASQGLVYYVWSLAFWYGSRLIRDEEYTFKQMNTVLFSVIFMAMALGQMSTFAPNSAKAKIAAISIFRLVDRKSAIDPSIVDEKRIRPAPVTGEAQVRSAVFNYPARPEVPILRGFDMMAHSGKTVALVGPSGSGKSSTIALLLRFYDTLSGAVNIEQNNVKDWNLEYLRSNMALVGQEPVLFDLTIGENIAYGKEGCSQEEIEAAAKGANIHNFIKSLPDGYNTSTGERGTQLSGGQKQRIAIARALIRNPKILLLDEATSALDSESEAVVQHALDSASKGRTTITIAHRLSTIQDADLILVVKKGKVVEQGKHLELIAQKGLYYDLVNKQTLTKKN